MGKKIIGMAGKVAGPRGSWRRRWAVLLSLVITVAASMAYIQTVIAVHDTGAFQLDGDASTSSNTAQIPFVAADDWDKVCYEVAVRPVAQGGGGLGSAAAAAKCGIGVATTGATATSWVAEPSAATSIFTGGGSKDPDFIANWLWKDEANNPPDKDNLIHAYAARYSLTPSQTCPSGGAATCEVLFFGSDRFDNSGDAQQGFWFLQSKVETTQQKGGGGLKFSGEHRPGDVLVISNFSNGGTTSTITVYEWDPVRQVSPPTDPITFTGCVATNKAVDPTNPKKTVDDTTCTDANLRLLADLQGTPAKCTTAGANDAACGIVNPELITMPWVFLDKTPTPNNGALNGEFYEAGLNLSLIGLGDECFSSVVAETRSSTSTTAVLKDFVVGQLGSCETTLTTTASLNANGTTIDSSATVNNGKVSSGTDSATLQVKGVSTWAGSLAFYLCGPIASPTVCNTDGVLVQTVAVSNLAGTQYQSIAATLTQAGRYCWFAKFTPDAATLAKGVLGTEHNGTPTPPETNNAECFIVRPAIPTLSTAVTATTVTFGSATTDVATISGLAKEPGDNGGHKLYASINATNGAFSGTLAYRLKGPDTVDGSGTTTVCSVTDATALAGTIPNAFPLNVTVGGNGTSPTLSANSVSFTPNAPGKYHWVAMFSGSGANGTSTNNVVSLTPLVQLPLTHNGTCLNTSEDVVVQQIPTTITSGPWTYPNDTATVSSNNAGQNLPTGGTLQFKLFGQGGGNPAAVNCNANGATGLQYTETISSVGGAASSGPKSTSNGPTAGGTPATGFRINSANFGTYYWRVTYTPPANSTHTGQVSQCIEFMQVSGSDDPPPTP